MTCVVLLVALNCPKNCAARSKNAELVQLRTSFWNVKFPEKGPHAGLAARMVWAVEELADTQSPLLVYRRPPLMWYSVAEELTLVRLPFAVNQLY